VSPTMLERIAVPGTHGRKSSSPFDDPGRDRPGGDCLAPVSASASACAGQSFGYCHSRFSLAEAIIRGRDSARKAMDTLRLRYRYCQLEARPSRQTPTDRPSKNLEPRGALAREERYTTTMAYPLPGTALPVEPLYCWAHDSCVTE
jgi:hypothetical protein